MALPITYNLRNMVVRWRATLATVLGVALVVAVYVLVQSLAAGLEQSSRNTGDPRNILLVRKGATAESSSQVTLDQFRILPYLPQVARDDRDRPLVSADVIVLVNLPRLDQSGEANVLVRGLTPLGQQLRPQVSLVEGRWFRPGHREVVVSRSLAARFANFGISNQFQTAGASMTVVGWLDGGNSAYDSEVWMDADEAKSLFDRQNYSSVLLRATGPEAATNLMARIEQDKRLPLQAEFETVYYSNQTKTATPIKILGNVLATAMSIGAMFAAMNTMYASVGSRTREIGTLRVLGYRRRSILMSFLLEGTLLAMVGGMIGIGLSFWMHGRTTATMGFETFSETVFQFRITPVLMLQGMIFAAVVGFVGSFLPALRAARVPIIKALKAT